jgi:pimeloyl-ACP methyl ester carboxylesterase
MYPSRLQSHIVDVGGATLEVLTGGNGSTTVCFAQYAGDSGLPAEGTELTQALEAEHRIILVNARGSGRSSASEKAPWRSLATDLEYVRQHFGVEQWVLSGYTNGAVSTLLYTIDHPEHVSALIVGFFGSTSKVWEREDSELSPAHPLNRELLSNMRLLSASETVPSQWLPIGEDRWVWLIDGTPHIVWPYPISEWAINLMEEANSIPNLLSHLDRVLVPTLVIAGAKDTITPAWDGQVLADGIAGAEFRVLPNSSHNALPIEDLPQHDDALRDFVRRHGNGKSKKNLSANER